MKFIHIIMLAFGLSFFTSCSHFGSCNKSSCKMEKCTKEKCSKEKCKNKKKCCKKKCDNKEKAAEIEGIFIIIRDRFGSVIGGRRGSPIEFTIKGPNPEKQKEFYKIIEEEMKKSNLMVGIRSDDVTELPEIHIVPKREAAVNRGVEIAEIAKTVNIATGGVVASQYTSLGRRFDIFVQLQEQDRSQPSEIEGLYLRNNRGELLNMKSVVDFKQASGPQNIFRENRERGIRVDANLSKGTILSEAMAKVKEIGKNVLPKDYYLDFSQSLEDSLLNILFIIILGLMISYMVLASQFNSFIDPLIVFVAVPFGISGSLVALYLGGQTLNVYSMIGIMLTIGIVKKNSILIVEFTNQLRDQGLDVEEALNKACTLRFRPILMTTLSTLAAALPAVMAFGPGSETRVPMGLVVLGGVSLSAIMTLYITPIIYLLFMRERTFIDKRVDQIIEESKESYYI